MSAVPIISVAAATGLLDAVAAAGGNPDQLLSTLGLKRSIFAKPDGFIASSSFTRILEEAARATGDDCFGLHLGESFDPRDLGTLAYVVLNSPTTAVAMQNIERYLRIHNEAANVSFTIDGATGAPALSRVGSSDGFEQPPAQRIQHGARAQDVSHDGGQSMEAAGDPVRARGAVAYIGALARVRLPCRRSAAP